MYWYSILVFLGLSSIGIWLPCSHFLYWKKIMQLDLVSNCMFIIIVSKQLRQACKYMFGFITTSSRHNITHKLKKNFKFSIEHEFQCPYLSMPDHHYTDMVHDLRQAHWVRTHHTLAAVFLKCLLSSLQCTSQSKIHNYFVSTSNWVALLQY